MPRYYYRCPTCLSAMTMDARVERAECVCGGKLQLLGPVNPVGRWLREEERPKCDGRCISALGPKCDCRCLGENHGQGLLAVVVATRDGGAAVVRPLDAEAALRRADEYRRAVQGVFEALAARYGAAWEVYRAGGWVQDRGTWEALRFWVRELDDARGLLTHRRRIQRLQELALRVREGRFY